LGGNHSRGFEDGDEPLIVSHDPEVIEGENRFGPRSAELTEHGIQLLSEFEASGYMGGGEREDEPETIKQLRARLDALESGSEGRDESDELRGRVERLEAEIDSIQDDPCGAVDTDVVGYMKEAIKSSKAMVYLFKSIFGIDVDQRVEDGSYPSDDAVEAERVDVYGVLSLAGCSVDSSEDFTGESVSDTSSGQVQEESEEASKSDNEMTQNDGETHMTASHVYTCMPMNWETERDMARDVEENEELYQALADQNENEDED